MVRRHEFCAPVLIVPLVIFAVVSIYRINKRKSQQLMFLSLIVDSTKFLKFSKIDGNYHFNVEALRVLSEQVVIQRI